MRRIFALIALALAAQAQANETHLLLLGDWGRERSDARHPGQVAVAAGMAKVAERLRPAAVVTLGDNFYETGPASPDDPIFRTAFEQVYVAPSLQVPFWVTLGNHEYMGSVRGHLEYAAKRMGSGRWTLPARHWARTLDLPGGATAKLIFIDTSPFIGRYRLGGHSDVGAQDTRAQLAWLAAELAEPGHAWRIVFGHHPAWSGGIRPDDEDIRREVLPVLLRGKADLYASGHEHHPEVVRRGGLLQLIAGNGSECRPIGKPGGALYQGQHLGFASLSLSAGRMTLRQHDETGAVRHELAVGR